MKSFATKHPLLFVLAITLAWILITALAAYLASVGMDRPIGSSTVQSMGALAVAGFAPQTVDFAQATLLELPLVLWGLWLLWRLPPRPVVPDTP